MMKKTLLLAVLTAMAATGASAQILNEVYAGGGSSVTGTSYTRDFVELYNPNTLPLSLSGYTLQYASSAGGFTNTILLFGTGSVIAAQGYLSVATGGAGTAGSDVSTMVTYAVPSNGGASLSNSAGAVRLINASGAVIDLIGYGSVTSPGSNGDVKVEGTAAPAPTNTTTSLNRTGFLDTNNNLADFTNGTPTPQTSVGSLVVTVPEPSTWTALAGGIGALIVVLRRRRTL